MMDNIALVLGAGGARGLAHIHVLKAFDELGLRPSVIAGTSIGSIMGSAFAAGMSGDEVEAYVMERFDDRVRLLSDVLKVRPESWKKFISDGGLRLGELNLESIFSVFLPEQIPETFAELSIPMHVVATDYYAGSATVFSSGPLHAPIAASAAIPAVFLPVEVGGRFYVDGSATNPCPIDAVQARAQHVLAIDVAGRPTGTPSQRPSKIDTVYAANQLMQRTMATLSAQACPHATLLHAPVDAYRSLDFLKSAEIISETAGLKEQAKTALGRMLEKNG